ncbi:MAG: sensor histidine kinase [Sphingomonadaceae bacterium]
MTARRAPPPRGATQRWVAALRRLVARYAGGDYRADLSRFRAAPPEVRDLVASLGRMAHAIDSRDRALKEAAEREASLARELNHRVRNNLQILSSYLSLEAASATSADARQALEAANLRISAIALMHRLLYDGGNIARLAAPELLGELCRLLERQGVAGRAVRMDCAIAELSLDLDTAVPLALLAIEAATALGEVCPGDGPNAIALTLSEENQTVAFEARALGACRDAAIGEAPLVRAIARQLGGSLQLLRPPAPGLLLTFPHRPGRSNEILEPEEQ